MFLETPCLSNEKGTGYENCGKGRGCLKIIQLQMNASGVLSKKKKSMNICMKGEKMDRKRLKVKFYLWLWGGVEMVS